MLTPQTDSVSCLALVLCESIIVKYIFLFYLLLVFLLPYRINGEIKLCKNTCSHNCMIHRDTMLKFSTLFDLAKYFEHT